MRKVLCAPLFWVLLEIILPFNSSISQTSEKNPIQDPSTCKTKECKLLKAFQWAEYYLETDEIATAQKWLDSCKIWNLGKTPTVPPSDLYSLQSELFYYFGLFQFGIAEADKGIDWALQEKDSMALADLYFFKGIHYAEIADVQQAEASLTKAEGFYPQKKRENHLRTFILPEHIFNNLGQLKLQRKQWDSAYYYNAKAYTIAQLQNSGRALANCEQTFGLIHLGRKQNDSAVFYLNKSKETALLFNYYDIATLAEGFLMKAVSPQKEKVLNHFSKGEEMIEQYPVNTLFKRLFYKEAVSVLDSLSLPKETIALQEKLLQIEDSIRFKGNFLVQDISQQYVATEKELFDIQRKEFEKQKKLNFLQLVASLLVIFSLMAVLLLFRRRNREQKKLLQQKTEISNDLHDDIGSGLTSILIHAQLLETNPNVSKEQKQSAIKIYQTGSEISQRLNTFIWTLNEAHDTLQDFLEYVKQYASKTFEGTPILFQYHEMDFDPTGIELHGPLRKNLFYAIKELINNTLKHSEATEVLFQVSLSEKKILQIVLEDNGVGLKEVKQFGNGLLNIEKRMQFHKEQFFYTSSKGFKAKLLVPL